MNTLQTMQSLPGALAPLAAHRQFILYQLVPDQDRPGKTHKYPIHPTTGRKHDAHDAAAWLEAQEAITLAARYVTAYGPQYGVGFTFTEQAQHWFLDIDHCLDAATNTWTPLAIELCQRLAGAYVEVSQSGKGLHIIGSGPVPAHACKNTRLGLEFYHTGRFCALTGIGATGSADWRNDTAVAAVVAQYFPADGSADRPPLEWTTEPDPRWRGPTDDADLIRRALASHSARAAFGGGASFADLWEARADVLAAAYPSSGASPWDQSSADMALAQHLSFWTGRNAERIKTLMLQSGLRRDKWGMREDWLDDTIMRAVTRQVEVLGSKHLDTSQVSADSSVAASTANVSLGVTEPRFRLLYDSDLEKLPVIPWRIKPVLPQIGLAAIFGPSGAGKSFLVIDMAACITEGRPWFGYRVTQSPVLYCALEGEAGIKQRRAASLMHRGSQGNPQMRFLTMPFLLNKPDDVTQLANEILSQGLGGCVVFIDTLSRAAAGADENSSEAMGVLIANTSRLQQLIGGVVVLVHHTGKDASRGLRGHSSLLAALDTAIEVQRNKAARGWQLVKSKEGEDGREHGFQLERVTLGVDDDGEPITSCVVVEAAAPLEKTLAPNVRSTLEKLHSAILEHGIQSESGEWGVSLTNWRDAYGNPTGNKGSARTTFGNHRKTLEDSAMVMVRKDFCTIIDPYLKFQIALEKQSKSST